MIVAYLLPCQQLEPVFVLLRPNRRSNDEPPVHMRSAAMRSTASLGAKSRRPVEAGSSVRRAAGRQWRGGAGRRRRAAMQRAPPSELCLQWGKEKIGSSC
jgi:hypothetical protein